MMGGSMMDDDRELINSPSNVVRTLVLFGRTGNGKSATGNTILGDKKAFNSKKSSSGVVGNCELQRTVLRDGKIINVIDTPGLFDTSAGSEFIVTEIGRCIKMAKDGSMQFWKSSTCVKNRIVLFNNKTKDEGKRVDQVEQLLSLVDMVVAQNGGLPYTDELFAEWKELEINLCSEQERFDSKKDHSNQQILEFKDKMERSYEEQLKRITEMTELKRRETTKRLEQQLAEEKAAKLKAEKLACLNQKKSNDEIRQLRENLVKAEGELRNCGNNNTCAIL